MRLRTVRTFIRLVTLVVLLPSLACSAPTSEIDPGNPLPTPIPIIIPKILYPKEYLNSGYFRSSYNISLGGANGVFDVNRQSESLGSLQFGRTQYNNDWSAQEFGLDFFSNGMMGWNLNYKYTMLEQAWAEPYYKLGLQAIYHSGQGLGNFVNYQRYFLRAGLGFDDLLGLRRRVRTEAFFSIGPLGSNFGAALTWAIPDEF
jgi:hypothetical protein